MNLQSVTEEASYIDFLNTAEQARYVLHFYINHLYDYYMKRILQRKLGISIVFILSKKIIIKSLNLYIFKFFLFNNFIHFEFSWIL